MKITLEMIHAAYAMAKRVYHDTMDTKDAVAQLADDYGMNEKSAEMYVRNFRKIMDGKVYKRTMSKYAHDYYLTRIRADYGVKKLLTAVDAVKKHVAYYEEVSMTEMVGIREVIEKYEKLNRDH